MKTKRIGYKATYNYKCQEITYEIGKTYKIDNIKMCNYGFHYCPNIKDVLEYYKVSKDLKILEIEDIGTESIQKEDKVCTNKIKVLREVPIKEHKLFKVDKNVVDIYSKVKESVEQKLDKSGLQDLNVLVYPKFDFNKKYIGFEVRLRF